MVRVDSTLAESGGRGPARDRFDLVALCLAATGSRSRRQSLRRHLGVPHPSSNFFTGLALVPIGVYLSKRQIQRGLSEEGFDRQRALRRIARFFVATTLLNIFIGTQVSYRAVKYMETPQFCGASCHTMNPELAAYRNSPHSRVECVECHVAPVRPVGFTARRTAFVSSLRRC